MRLRILDHSHRLRARILLRVIRLTNRTEPDPVAKVSLYRPELFGRAFMHLIEQVMRGPSDWSAGERELFAVFVSRLNSCRFCVGIHTDVAGLHVDPGLVARIDQWRVADFEPRIAATFALVEAANVTPDAVGPEDIARCRAAGVSDTAIADALYVAFVFNTINRLANALDFAWETDADRIKLAHGLNRIAYHVPRFLLR